MKKGKKDEKSKSLHVNRFIRLFVIFSWSMQATAQVGSLEWPGGCVQLVSGAG